MNCNHLFDGKTKSCVHCGYLDKLSQEQAINQLKACLNAGYPVSITLNGEEFGVSK
jgi:ribulose bisphosphate carboxylase small subunit